ncbi:MAG: hypothetical protein AMJ53_10510 [Gammaproteobacteria bacterium SG8_11]|nr:MAG: hypothetical protein AMJ53_10510 [Gammaproteobacteria bacterium SG8_11]
MFFNKTFLQGWIAKAQPRCNRKEIFMLSKLSLLLRFYISGYAVKPPFTILLNEGELSDTCKNYHYMHHIFRLNFYCVLFRALIDLLSCKV